MRSTGDSANSLTRIFVLQYPPVPTLAFVVLPVYNVYTLNNQRRGKKEDSDVCVAVLLSLFCDAPMHT